MSVVVIGSLNADITIHAAQLPRPGETVRGDSFATRAGGKGTNQAAAAALLGARVDVIGAIGTDAHGAMLEASLHQLSVGTSHLAKRDGHPTGVALIAVDARGENQIIVHPGANAALSCADIVGALDGLSPRVVGISLEIDVAAATAAAEAAAAQGATVVVNLSPFAAPAPRLVDAIDVLVVNEQEASELLGTELGELSIADIAPALQSRGFDRAVITRGRRGAVVVDRGAVDEVAPIPVTAIDSTGCGDAFLGALLRRLDAGDSLAAAATAANLVGAYAARGEGTISSYPTLDSLERFTKRLQRVDP